MDIHAPEHPILTWKQFATHIAVVTVGILIALALEGVREFFHDRHLVAETRVNFKAELREDVEHDDDESTRVKEIYKRLDRLIGDLPGLTKDHPEEVAHRLEQVQNPFYFFSDTSWQAALSTGALAHMPEDELATYASAFESVRTYSELQHQCMEAQDRAMFFFAAHPHPSATELEEGTERLMNYRQKQFYLVHVGEDLHRSLVRALNR